MTLSGEALGHVSTVTAGVSAVRYSEKHQASRCFSSSSLLSSLSSHLAASGDKLLGSFSMAHNDNVDPLGFQPNPENFLYLERPS